MKSKTFKKSKKQKLFVKYSKNNEYLIEKEIVSLMKKEFKLSYNKHIIKSLMNIWGIKINNKLVITFDSYLKMFQKEDGFFRNIKI
tara:strand:+ start:28 stop:285 length:258 start_codon:yes stop_codon:yes gene_type:complete